MSGPTGGRDRPRARRPCPLRRPVGGDVEPAQREPERVALLVQRSGSPGLDPDHTVMPGQRRRTAIQILDPDEAALHCHDQRIAPAQGGPPDLTGVDVVHVVAMPEALAMVARAGSVELGHVDLGPAALRSRLGPIGGARVCSGGHRVG